MEIEQNIWGFTPEGEAGVLYAMRNASGGEVRLTNAGAAVAGILLPDGCGGKVNVAAGYDSFGDYMDDAVAMGKIVGRLAGPVSRGRFRLGGREVRLSANRPPHHFDGGRRGFSSRLWEARTEVNRVVFSLDSDSGDEGYPGALHVEAAYDWDDDYRLEITVAARGDEDTPVDIVSGLMVDLSGHFTPESIAGHLLRVDASRYVETVGDLPTGRLLPVGGTQLDFRTERPIGDLDTADGPIGARGGLDHWLVSDGWRRGILGPAASLCDPRSGRRMNVYTSQPSVNLYSANAMCGSGAARGGREYADHSALAVRCTALPDAVNRAEFPTVVLPAGAMYVQKSVYEFILPRPAEI